MATVDTHVPGAAPAAARRSVLWDLMTTVDHKKIGILYGVSALVFLLVGGLEALIMRIRGIL